MYLYDGGAIREVASTRSSIQRWEFQSLGSHTEWYVYFLIGSSTLPRTTRISDTEGKIEKITAATSSTSLYDNIGATQTSSLPGTYGHHFHTIFIPCPLSGIKLNQREGSQTKQTRDRGVQPQSDTSTMTSNSSTCPKTVTASVGTENNVETQVIITDDCHWLMTRWQ